MCVRAFVYACEDQFELGQTFKGLLEDYVLAFGLSLESGLGNVEEGLKVKYPASGSVAQVQESDGCCSLILTEVSL